VEFAYRADGWQDFYTAVAGASAVLTGLLFVGLSLNLRTIIRSPAHKARAREALAQLLSLLVLAVIVLIPGQSRRILGTELIALGIILLTIVLRLQSQTILRLTARQRYRWIGRFMVENLGIITMPVSGVSLILGRYGGLYWLVPPVAIYFVWSSINAWTLVVQAIEESA
jgi:hypothetical protein